MANQPSRGSQNLIQSILNRLNALPRLRRRVVARPVLDLSGLRPETRNVNSRPIPIIDCLGQGSRRLQDTLAAPGTITVYVGQQGSRRLAMVRAGARKGGEAAIQTAHSLRQHLSMRRRLPFARALEVLGRSPVYGEIHIGYRSLATYIVTVHPDDVAVLTFSYNGGRLPSSGLMLVQRSRPNTHVRLEAVAVRNSPPLTKTEKVALETPSSWAIGAQCGPPGVRVRHYVRSRLARLNRDHARNYAGDNSGNHVCHASH